MNSAPESMRRADLRVRGRSSARPDACPQSVRRGVGELDGLVVRGERDDRGCRSECLLGHHRHVEGDVDQDGRRVPGRTSRQPFASGQDPRAGRRRRPRPAERGSRRGRRGPAGRSSWPSSRGVADDQVGDGGGEPPAELVDQRLVHDEALGAQAGLAGVEEAAGDGLGDDDVEVGVLEHDERVGPAELEQALLRGPTGAGRDVGAGPVAAGQGDGGDAVVLDQVGRRSSGTSGSAMTRVRNTFVRQAGVAEDLLDRERDTGDVRGVLEQSGVAGHQRRGGEAEHLPEGEVPRHDRQHGAQWLVADPAARAGRPRRPGRPAARERSRRSTRRPRRTSRPRRPPRWWACPSRRWRGRRARSTAVAQHRGRPAAVWRRGRRCCVRPTARCAVATWSSTSSMSWAVIGS